MRVIAGEKKGMGLQGPGKSDKTRPTLDAIKENIFNIFQPIPSGAVVLDLFAGSGQMGIEFLSRGAGFAYFCEKERSMVKVIEKNLEKTGYQEKAILLQGDFRRCLGKIDKPVKIVYLDPPYGYGFVEEAMDLLVEKDKLEASAIVIVEREANEKLKEHPCFQLIFDRTYHTQRIQIYQKKEESEL